MVGTSRFGLLLGLCLVWSAAPAAAQIVRSSRDAPSTLKNRAAMLSPWTRPIVPA